MIDINIIKQLIIDLSDLIVKFNLELKYGINNDFVIESDIIFNLYINEYPELNQITTIDPNYGLNIILSGLTGKVLFPSFLLKNPFRLQTIKELKFFLRRELLFADIESFITKKAIATYNMKKGGFSRRTLEVLRFYLTYFDNVIDYNVNKFYPFYKMYQPKYINIGFPTIEKRFPLTQKYTSYYLMPKYSKFGINAIMIRQDRKDNFFSDTSNTFPFGLLFNDQKEKEFSFYFTAFDRKVKDFFIEKICFFENLDLFYEDQTFKKLIHKTSNILNLYYDYKDGIFNNTAISFENSFIRSQKFVNQVNDLDLIIHLFNTRKLPIDHEIHPISKYLIMYRNKVVNFYSTTNYFIYIYDQKGKALSRYIDLLMTLLKNTFSNGYIIQSRSQLLISTFLFKYDFESQKSSLLEFIHSFKLEIQIFENLNLIPFSFYQLPGSSYFDIEQNNWNFPSYQEKTIDEVLNYQIQNLELERSRLEDNNFRKRVREFFKTWTSEVNYIKEN